MTRDVGGFMGWFLSEMVKMVSFCFGLLDSITFLGVSLLDYFIALFLLSVVLPIIFSLVKSRAVGSKSDRRQKGSESD